MKLIGIARLHSLAQMNAGQHAASAAALLGELAAANWTNPEAVQSAFPSADVSGQRIEIALGSSHCVNIIVHYGAGIAMIQYAGPRERHDTSAGSEQRRSS